LITLHNPKLVGEWYTPESQREEETPFRVRLRPLTGMQQLEVLSANQGISGFFRPAAMRLAWRYGVAGTEGADIPEGLDIEGREIVDYIDEVAILREVADEILRISQPSEDEKKT